MQQHGSTYLLIDPLPRFLGWGQKVKIQLFQTMVILHIKFKGIANAATCKQYSVLTHTLDPWGRSKVKTFFSESSHVAYQIV